MRNVKMLLFSLYIGGSPDASVSFGGKSTLNGSHSYTTSSLQDLFRNKKTKVNLVTEKMPRLPFKSSSFMSQTDLLGDVRRNIPQADENSSGLVVIESKARPQFICFPRKNTKSFEAKRLTLSAAPVQNQEKIIIAI